MIEQHHDTRWAVITGASSGFGALFADRLARQGFSLLLAGRNSTRLAEVARLVEENVPGTQVALAVGDLTTPAGLDDLERRLRDLPVDTLINNAGFGTYGPFTDIETDREHELVAVNADALVRLTHAVLPGMIERQRGAVLNVASLIAFQPAPYQATYGASKAFVLSFSQALWAETRGSGVTVTALCPGPTRTGFVDAMNADVSHISIYKRLADPAPVVDAGLRGLKRGRAVVVPGWRNRLLASSGRLMPTPALALVGERMLRPSRASGAIRQAT